MHFTPVHCSWMNQVEQWFSILQRKRLRAPNFADLADLEAKILAFIDEWNEIAHPFDWTAESPPTPLERCPQGGVMVTKLRGAVPSGNAAQGLTERHVRDTTGTDSPAQRRRSRCDPNTEPEHRRALVAACST